MAQPKRIQTEVTDEAHKQMQLMAIHEGLTVQDIVRDALKMWANAHGHTFDDTNPRKPDDKTE